MKVLNNLYYHETLKVYQDSTMFNFSLDSISLAAFCTIKKSTTNILDIGCNNAVIPIILSLRTDANITGIEIQKQAASLGIDSVKYNNLESQITIINSDIKQYAKECLNKNLKYDLIVSNPPFFIYDPKHVKMRKNESEIIARNEKYLTMEQLIHAASLLCKDNAFFAVIYPPDRIAELIVKLTKYNFAPKRMRILYPRRNKQANLVLLESRYRGNTGLRILQPLFCHTKNHDYCAEIISWGKGNFVRKTSWNSKNKK